jgi:hypothetical protein
MSDGSLKTEIGGIEAQLRVLKASRAGRKEGHEADGLRALKGALRGQGQFTPEETDAARARFKDDG